MKNSLQQQLNAAGAALQEFDWVRAGQLYSDALKEHPDNGGALMGIAMLCNRQGRHVEALEILRRIWESIQKAPPKQQAAVADSTKAEILAQMGLALQLLKLEDQALPAYVVANKLYPSPQLTVRIANLKDKERHITPTAKLITKAQKLVAEGKVDAAIETFREVLTLNPDHDVALHALSDLYRQRGELQFALPLVQQAIIMQPNQALYHNTLGMIFQQKGEFEKALIFHRRAIDLDPKYAAAHCNLGVALKNLDRPEEAAAEYTKALRINPAMPEAHNNLGNLYRVLGKLGEAKASLLRALKLRPDYTDAKRNLQSVEAAVQAAGAALIGKTPVPKVAGGKARGKAIVMRRPGKEKKKGAAAKPSAKANPASKKAKVTIKPGLKAPSAATGKAKVRPAATKAGLKARPAAAKAGVKAKPAAAKAGSKAKVAAKPGSTAKPGRAGVKAQVRGGKAKPGAKKNIRAVAQKKRSRTRR